MKLVPKLTATRFEQVTPGDLFIFFTPEQTYVALAAKDFEQERQLMLILGPEFPEGTTGAHLFPWKATTVISFGRDYELRLPTSPTRWSALPPSDPARHCIFLDGDAPYVRANCSPYPGRFQPCYVRMSDGLIKYDGSPIGACCRPRIIGHGQGFPRAAMNSRGERYPRALCG